jgi:hypothetical protein
MKAFCHNKCLRNIFLVTFLKLKVTVTSHWASALINQERNNVHALLSAINVRIMPKQSSPLTKLHSYKEDSYFRVCLWGRCRFEHLMENHSSVSDWFVVSAKQNIVPRSQMQRNLLLVVRTNVRLRVPFICQQFLPVCHVGLDTKITGCFPKGLSSVPGRGLFIEWLILM